MSLHESVKYPCNQCEYKATQRSNLKTHKMSVHENVKYPCNQCEYKATTNSSLKTHKCQFIRMLSILVINVNTKQQQTAVSKHINVSS